MVIVELDIIGAVLVDSEGSVDEGGSLISCSNDSVVNMRMGWCSAEQRVATNTALKRRWKQFMICGD